MARSYCPEHQPIGWTSGGYSRTSTAAHRKWRDAVLERDRYVCQLRTKRCAGTATEADHVIPVADGGPELDVGNGQAACGPCHQMKSQQHAVRKSRAARRPAPTRTVGSIATNPDA